MYNEVDSRAKRLLDAHSAAIFAKRNIGLEKESLRVAADGAISQQRHPSSLGSPLCNKSITTDFSEALIEMVTPPCKSPESVMAYLTGLHQFIVARLPDQEHLWNTSMPCILQGEQSIRIGQYGNSHNGQMKQAYRRGLGLRYGRRMQAIAGVHFNFSFDEAIWPVWQKLHGHQHKSLFDMSQRDALRTEGYFHMTRNLMRVGWMVPYLFGASPAICQSFLGEDDHPTLKTFNGSTRYEPFGTSLRLGNIGYQYRDDKNLDLSVCHSNFECYMRDIIGHVSEVHLPYKKTGIRDDIGRHQQLTANRLQIENEYYSSVRPKQIAEAGEMPIVALKKRGIRYLELRSVDINLLHDTGVNLEQIAMLEMLMMFAWLADSPPLEVDEMRDNASNMTQVAHNGRKAGLQLINTGKPVALDQWGLSIVDSMQIIAQQLDCEAGGDLYVRSLEQQRAKLLDSDKTPSAVVLAGIKERGSFFDYALDQSVSSHDALSASTAERDLSSKLAKEVSESIQDLEALEAQCSGSFEVFLQEYFTQLPEHAMASAVPV
ncbi:MAG: glutamate--cysteine ligase [Granulosicoccaceae bacterium]